MLDMLNAPIVILVDEKPKVLLTRSDIVDLIRERCGDDLATVIDNYLPKEM